MVSEDSFSEDRSSTIGRPGSSRGSRRRISGRGAVAVISFTDSEHVPSALMRDAFPGAGRMIIQMTQRQGSAFSGVLFSI
jgi:hypothetical protein